MDLFAVNWTAKHDKYSSLHSGQKVSTLITKVDRILDFIISDGNWFLCILFLFLLLPVHGKDHVRQGSKSVEKKVGSQYWVVQVCEKGSVCVLFGPLL
jgi:hypothetical protein